MKNKPFLKYSIRVVSIALLFGSCFPMFRAVTGIPLFFPSFIVLIVLILISDRMIFISSPSLWIILSALFFAAYSNSGDLMNFGKMILTLFGPLIISLIFIEHYKKQKDYRGIRLLVYAVLLLIIIRCITGINAENIFPGIARTITGGEMGKTFAQSMNKIGVATYTFINALPFLFIPFVYIVKKSNDKRLRLFMSVIILLSLFAVIKTSWAAALIFSVIAIFIGFIVKSSKRILTKIVSTFIVVIFINLFSVQILDLAGNAFSKDTGLSKKINDVQQSLNEKARVGEIEQRGELYDISIGTFLKNPFLGSMNGAIGGHTFWIDLLAQYGILGVFPFFMAIISLYRKSLYYLPEDYKYLSHINLTLFFAFGCLKTVGEYDFYLFTLVLGPFAIFNYIIIPYQLRMKKTAQINREQELYFKTEEVH